MTFNDEIYTAFCSIWPTTNVRAFSRALGRSTGYWNSIKSQNLPLSDMALKNLQNTLETQMLIAKHEPVKRRMVELQRKIAQELVRRLVEQCETDEQMLEEMEQVFHARAQQKFSSSIPMPIVITTNSSYGDFR